MNTHTRLIDERTGRQIDIDVTPLDGYGAAVTVQVRYADHETSVSFVVPAADCAALAEAFEKGYAS